MRVTRRVLLAGAAASLALPSRVGTAADIVRHRLTPRVASQRLVEPDAAGYPPATEIWGYDGRAPGPTLRARQGQRLEVEVDNQLPATTSVHWHGLRLPVEMDGVPHMPMPPILPGARFTYAFDLHDAGTFWYHPHVDDSEQLGRGLSGALIVEEPSPPTVDRDLVWLLSDWRLDDQARIDPRFDAPFDVAHGGRIGNTVTIDGRVPERVAVAGKERLRLRLINAASARIFELAFTGHAPVVLAWDAQPVARPAAVDRVVLAPGQRADLLLDCPHGPGEPGATERYSVIDHGDGSAKPNRLVDLAYGAPIRPMVLTDPVVLPANPLPVPDLQRAVPSRIVLEGGAMGQLRQARLEGEVHDLAHLARRGRVWALNGVVGSSHYHFDDPLLTLKVGQTGLLTVVNATAWPHPVHLHGFPVLQITGDAPGTSGGEWRDTVLLDPGQEAQLAFVAEAPGTWMFHCHILEHQSGGMMGFVNVTP